MQAHLNPILQKARRGLRSLPAGFALLLCAVSTPLQAAKADEAAWPSSPIAQWLGLSEAALPTAVPDIQRLRRPQTGPRGLKAWWALPTLALDRGQLDTLFFARKQSVVHIEERWRAEPAHCKAGNRYQTLVTQISQRLGQSGVANGDAQTAQASTAWAAGPYDVRLYLNQMSGSCQLLLVHELHAERDATEL